MISKEFHHAVFEQRGCEVGCVCLYTKLYNLTDSRISWNITLSAWRQFMPIKVLGDA